MFDMKIHRCLRDGDDSIQLIDVRDSFTAEFNNVAQVSDGRDVGLSDNWAAEPTGGETVAQDNVRVMQVEKLREVVSILVLRFAGPVVLMGGQGESFNAKFDQLVGKRPDVRYIAG